MSVTYLRMWAGSEDLLFENIDGAHFDINGKNVTVRGGDFGPCQGSGRCLPVFRLWRLERRLIEATRIHSITSTDLVRYHVDGMAILGVGTSPFALRSLRQHDHKHQGAELLREHADPESNAGEQLVRAAATRRRCLAAWGRDRHRQPGAGPADSEQLFGEGTGPQFLGNYSGSGTRFVGNLSPTAPASAASSTPPTSSRRSALM